MIRLHPIPITRFRCFRTQPLESLSATVKLPIKKRFLGNPTLGTSTVRENVVMGTGCTNTLRLRGVRIDQEDNSVWFQKEDKKDRLDQEELLV